MRTLIRQSHQHHQQSQPLELHVRAVRNHPDVKTKYYLHHTAGLLEKPTQLHPDIVPDIGTLYIHKCKTSAGSSRRQIWMWCKLEATGVQSGLQAPAWHEFQPSDSNISHPLASGLYLHFSNTGLPGWVLRKTARRRHVDANTASQT